MTASTVGPLMRALRRQLGQTQHELASDLGVAQTTIAKWENGTGVPSPKHLPTIAAFLGIPQAEVATMLYVGLDPSARVEQVRAIREARAARRERYANAPVVVGPRDTGAHLVYLHFGDNGNLLYVGYTADFGPRHLAHRASAWWPDVSRIVTYEYDSAAVALFVEAQVIAEHKPPHNRQHNLARAL